MLEVKKMPEQRWNEYRAIRLEALKYEPLAFSSSFEEEQTMADDEWKKRIGNVLFALSHDKPLGMIGYIINNRLKTQHIAHIFGVYVQKEYRCQGIGRTLIERAIDNIRKNTYVSKISLTVNPLQKAAVKLYKKYGFKLAGILKKEMKVDDKFYNVLVMEKLL
jgi:ribosomal protein S18 acetylase RimI-like enzyme